MRPLSLRKKTEEEERRRTQEEGQLWALSDDISMGKSPRGDDTRGDFISGGTSCAAIRVYQDLWYALALTGRSQRQC